MTVTTLAYIPSPAQGVWHLGPVPLRAYALCIIIGIVAALVIGDRRWEARGGERGVIYDIALWAVPFGLIGGRIYHVLTDWPTYFGAGGAGLSAAFRIWDGGLGIWGAVALGGVGAWIACRRRGIPLPAFGDAIAPGIILAQAIGRLGNYFNQELYGRATTLPWGLEIYERRDAAGFRDTLNGVSTGEVVGVVHPTFLYELLWNLLVFALLLWVDRRYKLGHGRVFALYVAGYCLGRFWIELMRSDAATLIAGIRVNSFTSTFIFIAAVVYIMVAPKGREEPSTLRGNAPADEEAAGDEAATEVLEVGAVAGVVAAAKVAGEAEGADAAGAGEPSVADAADEADEVEQPVSTDVLEIGEQPEAEGDGAAADDEVEDSPEAEAAAVDADVEAAGDVAEEPDAEVDETAAEEPAAQDESAGADEEPGTAEDSSDVAADEVADSPEAEAAAVDADVEAAGDVAEEPVAQDESAVADEEPGTEVDSTDAAEDSAEAEAAAVDADVEAVGDVAEEPVAQDESAVADEEPGTEVDSTDAAEDSAVAEAAAVDADVEAAGDVAEEPVAQDESAVADEEPGTEVDSTDAAEDSAEAEAAAVEAAVEEPAGSESDIPAPQAEETAASDSGPDEARAEAQPAETGTEPTSVGERFRKPRWFRRNS